MAINYEMRPRLVATALSLTLLCACRDATNPDDPQRFNFTIEYAGSVPADVRLAFDSAASLWERAVVGDLPATQIDAPLCELDASRLVDDVLVLVTVGSIDGSGGFSGMHFSCAVRGHGSATGDFTVEGALASRVALDEQDLDAVRSNGLLFNLVLHELGHAIGFTPLIFAGRGCLGDEAPGDNTSPAFDTHFNCVRARAVFDSLGGGAYVGQKVPLENCTGFAVHCDPGRANFHWRETAFGSEVMTTFLDAGASATIGAVTLAALEDIGHIVDYSAAAPWSYSASAISPAVTVRVDQVEASGVSCPMYSRQAERPTAVACRVLRRGVR